jgi:hypothetical protein
MMGGFSVYFSVRISDLGYSEIQVMRRKQLLRPRILQWADTLLGAYAG